MMSPAKTAVKRETQGRWSMGKWLRKRESRATFKTGHYPLPLSHDRDEPRRFLDAYRPGAEASGPYLVLDCHGEGGRRICDPPRSERDARCHAALMRSGMIAAPSRSYGFVQWTRPLGQTPRSQRSIGIPPAHR